MCNHCKEKDKRIKELEDIIYNAMYEEELAKNIEKDGKNEQ
ncbi:MAG: hypothetical protein WCG23_00205 [bacterium]